MNSIEIIYNVLPETEAVAFEKMMLPEEGRKRLERDLTEISTNVELKIENIGAGADWIVVIATLSGLFFLGERINKNLYAWKEISKKFAGLFKRTAIAFVDANGARLIAIGKILDNERLVDSIEEIVLNEINLSHLENFIKDGRKKHELKSKPFCYYNMIYCVNDISYYIISVKSNGQIRSLDKIEQGESGFNKEFKLEF